MPYFHRFTVRFSEVDAAGIVYFSRVFEYCHAAFEALLEEGGLPLSEILGVHGEARGWGLPLVHSEARFRRPMRLGDALVVEVVVPEHAGGRVVFAYELRDGAGDVKATARFTHAAIGLYDFKPRPLPEELLAALRAAGALSP